MDLEWYLRRLGSMGPTEVVHRAEDAIRRRWWRSRPPAPPPVLTNPVRRSPIAPGGLADGVDDRSRAALVAEADQLLAGRWTMFGRPRTDMTADVDWFVDFVSGVRAPDRAFSLSIDHRDEATVGNIKYVWEAARHQHLTLLAAAFAVTGDVRYAERIDAELRHYWRSNPFLAGIHWTSGIEIGLRLIAWTWIRRLIAGWPGAAALFEGNPIFVEQLGRHHQWLAALGSHGSSANNHLIAEAAGQFVAASGFPLFADSASWQTEAAGVLARELEAQTFPDGLNRELASDYHGFVLELALPAWVEAVLVDHPVADELVAPMGRAIDALNAVVDVRGRPHRQGDSDDASGWLVDPIGYDRWSSLRRTGAVLVRPADWWPPVAGGVDVRTAVVRAAVAGRHRPSVPAGRPATRPALFPDAGLSLLRAEPDPGRGREELWCMFDHGPLGFLSTAAHGHADALAVEVRVGGVEVVADPGTYCYHGERAWRDHFRSTPAHATVTLDGASQSEMAGPFLWTRKAEATLEAHQGLEGGEVAMSRARHDGYRPLGWCHRREVRLDRRRGILDIVDALEADPSGGGDGPSDGSPAAPTDVEVAFPLGPEVTVELDPGGTAAVLTWPAGEGGRGGVGSGRATVTLDGGLSWSVVRGSESPPAGWYSDRFGTRVPASRLVGRASAAGPGVEYRTSIALLPSPPEGS